MRAALLLAGCLLACEPPAQGPLPATGFGEDVRVDARVVVGEAGWTLRGLAQPVEGPWPTDAALRVPGLGAGLDAWLAAQDADARLDLALAVEAGPATPFRRVAQVLYTAGQAAVPHLVAAVRTGAGVQGVALAIPKMCAAPPPEGGEGLAALLADRPGEACQTVHLTVTPAGASAVWHPARTGDCNGTVFFSGVSDRGAPAADALAALRPWPTTTICPGAVVQATPDAPWDRVVQAVVILRLLGVEHVFLGWAG